MTVLQKFTAMQSFNTEKVISFMLRERWAETQDKAREAVTALIQWFAAHAVVNHQKPFVMMHGPVDKAFHAFVLHTRLYYKFCEEHVGYFINHTPLDVEGADEFRIMGGVEYTNAYLKEEFGESLSPLLREWNVNPTISAVSCTGNDLEGLRTLPIKEDFWNEVEALEAMTK